MTDESAMTPEEQARVDAAIDGGQIVKLISTSGRAVTIFRWQVDERLAAGYEFADDPQV